MVKTICDSFFKKLVFFACWKSLIFFVQRARFQRNQAALPNWEIIKVVEQETKILYHTFLIVIVNQIVSDHMQTFERWVWTKWMDLKYFEFPLKEELKSSIKNVKKETHAFLYWNLCNLMLENMFWTKTHINIGQMWFNLVGKCLNRSKIQLNTNNMPFWSFVELVFFLSPISWLYQMAMEWMDSWNMTYIR